MQVPSDDTPRAPHTPHYLAIIIVLGAALRLYLLFATQWLVEADEAAVGLQALHILRGERPIFFPGQAYLGNFESYLVAAVFALLGPSAFALKLVPFVFALLFIWLSYKIGAELLGDVRVGLFAALMAALAPAYFVLWSVKARGGFIEALVLAQLALLWFARWTAPASAQTPRWLSGLIFGFIAGYTLWMNPLVVYLLAPIGLVLVFHALRHIADWRRARMPTLSALLGGLFGLLPFLLYRLANGRDALRRVANDAPPESAWRDLAQKVWRYLWEDGLPTLLGLREPRAAFVPDWRMVVIPIYALALLALLWQARRSRSAAALALLLVVTFPIFEFGSITGGNFAVIIPDSGLLTRYLLPLYIVFFVALGLLLANLPRVLRFGALVVLIAANLWSVVSPNAVAYARNEFSNQPLPADMNELIAFLSEHDIHYVYANHWMGFPLMLLSEERILTFDFPDVRFAMDRFPDYQAAVQGAPNPALLVFNPHHEPNPIDARLKQLRYRFDKQELQHFIVYYNFTPRLDIAAIEDSLRWPYY